MSIEGTKIHCLKTWPQYYSAVVSGMKQFEIRKNDRDFHVGDCLVLQEYDPERKEYTREMFAVEVTYITDFPDALRDGYVAIGIKPWVEQQNFERVLSRQVYWECENCYSPYGSQQDVCQYHNLPLAAKVWPTDSELLDWMFDHGQYLSRDQDSSGQTWWRFETSDEQVDEWTNTPRDALRRGWWEAQKLIRWQLSPMMWVEPPPKPPPKPPPLSGSWLRRLGRSLLRRKWL